VNYTIAHTTLESFMTGFWLSSHSLADRPDIDRPYQREDEEGDEYE